MQLLCYILKKDQVIFLRFKSLSGYDCYRYHQYIALKLTGLDIWYAALPLSKSVCLHWTCCSPAGMVL